MRAAIIALSLAALLAGQGQSAEPETPTTSLQTPDPAAVDAAVLMLEAQDFEAQILSTTDVMIEGMVAVQIEQLQKNSDEPIPADFLTSFRQTMHEHATGTMKAKMPTIKRQAAEIYAREFTVAELRRMAEIAGDPVMVKSRAKGQALSSQLMLVGMNAMRESQEELKQKLEQMVQDYAKKAGLTIDDNS